MKKIMKLKSQADRLRSFAKKIIMLEAAGEHISFRKEFGEKWQIEHETDNRKYDRYRRKLQHFVEKYKFEESELSSLEQYLQEAKLILTRPHESSEKELGKYRDTRDWDSVFLVRWVAAMRQQGKTYKKIATEYNRILSSHGIPKRITAGSLKTVMSRADKRLDGKLEDLKINL